MKKKISTLSTIPPESWTNYTYKVSLFLKGGLLKSDVIIKGGIEIMTWNDKGGGGFKITGKTSDVINERPFYIYFFILSLV